MRSMPMVSRVESVDGIVDRREPEVAVQDLGGPEVAGEVVAVAGTVDDVLEPVVQHRDPADAALAHDDLEIGVLHRVARPQPLRARAQRQLPEERGAERHHRRTGGHVGHAGGADVQADHRVGLGARRDHGIPPLREDRLHADAVRHLGQGHRGEAARRVAADLVRRLRRRSARYVIPIGTMRSGYAEYHTS